MLSHHSHVNKQQNNFLNQGICEANISAHTGWITASSKCFFVLKHNIQSVEYILKVFIIISLLVCIYYLINLI